MQKLNDSNWQKDKKLFYRDADDIVQIVSDQYDFCEARLQHRDKKMQLYCATDSMIASQMIPKSIELANSMVKRMLDDTVLSEES
jgi:hypothetical protein